MAYFSFSQKIMKGEPIKVFNYGVMYRDFTYIDDIVTGVERILCSPPVKDGVWHKVYNYMVYGAQNSRRIIDA
ncbi:NAD dependent epimerase/dehydratase family [Desulfotomaculum arcticum]|uniref:NAD dependent epimerase/dehydratase family n=1 Tax=Desulfotruncus arcticus DSM 17038 TaxID=1121424 RepID=A0A1I2Q412_9FIRM|nr:NAD dependent epimerase/dehydratase family [Desulfotomaculum arcticum] [Desulfotruncus arcticus DSM 17038]